MDNILQALFTLLLPCTLCAQSFGGSDQVLLQDVKVLTLYHGRMTTSRRSGPVPQLKCVGGTAGCNSFVPQVVQCYNRGSDGTDVQWECKSDMDNAYRFGQVEVTCEGFDYPDDPYVLKGSCGLEYTLDFTKEGHEQQHKQGHSYYGGQSHGAQDSHSYSQTKGSSTIGTLIMLAIIAVVIYAIYKTCIENQVYAYTQDRPDEDQHRRPNGPPPAYGSAPPPYGFRDDHAHGSDDCSSSRQHQPNRGASFGSNFWTGAATGGILGYMFGNSGNTYQRRHPGNSWGSSWTSGFGSGSGLGGRSGFGGGSGFGSSGSSGTRTASGFGGTRRR